MKGLLDAGVWVLCAGALLGLLCLKIMIVVWICRGVGALIRADRVRQLERRRASASDSRERQREESRAG